jgi:hypothetical protein
VAATYQPTITGRRSAVCPLARPVHRIPHLEHPRPNDDVCRKEVRGRWNWGRKSLFFNYQALASLMLGFNSLGFALLGLSWLTSSPYLFRQVRYGKGVVSGVSEAGSVEQERLWTMSYSR